MISYKVKAFTLVELVVSLTIITILGIIGFVSYQGYIYGARDTNRLSQLAAIYDGLETYKTRNYLPLPENNISVLANGGIVGYQGYMGKNNLEIISYNKGGIDPKDKNYFTYYVTQDKKYFQLLGFLEDISNKQVFKSPLNRATAFDYSSRFPVVIGKKLGILTEKDTNTPIQDINSIKSAGFLDIGLTTNEYTAHYSDTSSITGDSSVLIKTLYNSSCKRLKEAGCSEGDGLYVIDPTGNNPFQVYCDMSIDGGGWTLVGRSVKSGTGSFGFSSEVGTAQNDSLVYSLGKPDLDFSEILFGDYVYGKTWGSQVFKKIGQFTATTSSSMPTIEVKGTCITGFTKLKYAGYKNNNLNFFLSPNGTINTSIGLLAGGFVTGNGCLGGNIDGKQGMIFIR
nr:fibrinogen-like YCDxxxxGGGW domain-containing protein [Candidatus Gracilibacteria bacterium]